MEALKVADRDKYTIPMNPGVRKSVTINEMIECSECGKPVPKLWPNTRCHAECYRLRRKRMQREGRERRREGIPAPEQINNPEEVIRALRELKASEQGPRTDAERIKLRLEQIERRLITIENWIGYEESMRGR